MSLSSSAYTTTATSNCTSPVKSDSSSSPPPVQYPNAITSSCSLGSREAFKLRNDQILVKLSYVNDTLSDLKVEVYDGEGREECHFVRIVRVGPKINNRESTVPGVLVVTNKSSGIFLDELSREYGEIYYLLLESDITTYIDL